MKMIEELYQEVLENDAMKQEFAEAMQDGRVMEFLKKHGCEAETEEVNAFLKEQQKKRASCRMRSLRRYPAAAVPADLHRIPVWNSGGIRKAAIP